MTNSNKIKIMTNSNEITVNPDKYQGEKADDVDLSKTLDDVALQDGDN